MVRWRFALLLPVALVPAGCGGDGGAPATAPTLTFVEPQSTDGTPPENLALPLTSLLWASRTDERLIGMASREITARCMADRGFDFPAWRDEEWGHPPVSHPFGPWTEEEVADGYGGTSSEPQYSAVEDYEMSLSDRELTAWLAAYHGPSPFGGAHSSVTLPDGREVESGFADGYRSSCAYQGFDAVFGDYAAREELRQEIEALVNEASVEAEDHDDVVGQALEVWHDCMEAEGVDVAGGGAGPDRLAVRYISEPGVSDEERQVAALDIRCKGEANLHDTYFAVLAAAEQELIDENQVFVEAWRELKEESLARARAILADAD